MDTIATDDNERKPAKDALPADVARAIEEVLFYLWQDEQDNFIADEPAPGDDHIFRSLVAVDGWFYGHQSTAEEMVETFCSEGDKATARMRARSFRGFEDE